MKVALVLGGGGARGLAHLGVFKVFEKEKIKFDYIVGCSFGAIIGAMYAQTPQVALVEKRLRSFVQTEAYRKLGIDKMKRQPVQEEDYFKQLTNSIRNRVMLNVVASRISVLKGERIKNAVYYLVKPGKIEDTHIPFACNSTDLITGRPVLFTQGDIRKAVLASSSIPGFFPPIQLDGKMLVDGAVTYNLPIKFARALGADFIIAVDVHPVLQKEENLNNVFDVFLRANTITATLLTEESLHEADLIITPDVGQYLWYDFDRAEHIVRAGVEAAYAHVEALKQCLPSPKIHRFRKLLRLRMSSHSSAE